MLTLLWLAVGAALAVGFIAIGRSQPAHQARISAVGLIVAALVYVGFAIAASQPRWVLIALAGVTLYSLFPLLSYVDVQRSLLWLAIGWLLHPVWDIGLHLRSLASPELAHSVAPGWYALACLSFDIVVGTYLSWAYWQLAQPPEPTAKTD